MLVRRLVLALSVLSVGSVSAIAADLPIKAPPAAIVSERGYYFWIDGMYDRIRLPTYALGLHNVVNAGGFPDAGSTVQTFDPHLNGGGVRGAIGYILPGSTIKFELGGSYVAATGTNSAVTASPTFDVSAQLLNGAGAVAFICPAPISCSTAGTLSTRYSAWQFNGKVAADLKAGAITLTPSVAAFGGISRAGQTLSQAFTQTFGGAIVATGTYAADTTLRWTDIGARLGLDASVPLTPAFVFGLGGWVGFAERHTSFDGNDRATSTGGNL